MIERIVAAHPRVRTIISGRYFSFHAGPPNLPLCDWNH